MLSSGPNINVEHMISQVLWLPTQDQTTSHSFGDHPNRGQLSGKVLLYFWRNKREYLLPVVKFSVLFTLSWPFKIVFIVQFLAETGVK